MNKDEANRFFDIFDKNWIKERKLEYLRFFISSYYELKEDFIKNKVLPFILGLKFKKIKKVEIGFEMYFFHTFKKKI